uniref:Caspase-3 n=1 Tax=Eucheira socialis TaxID=320213 RepID=G0XQF6_9NEOP|nr:caspase-3 [Eucheira socialis]
MEESRADATVTDKQETNSSFPLVTRTRPSFNPNDLYYYGSGKKYLYIFNHYTFQTTKFFNDKQPSMRNGTSIDAIRLPQVFSELGFEVETLNDKTHRQILDKFQAISSKDHTETCYLFFAFLSHGDNIGNIYAADRPYQFKDVLTFLEHGHLTLIAKPKVFFVQACRGGLTDVGRRIEMDSNHRVSYVVPTHADFFIMYSTVQDHKSYRNKYGSFFIQDLCDIVEDYHEFYDLLHLVTLVQNRVAFLPHHARPYQNGPPQQEADARDQIHTN